MASSDSLPLSSQGERFVPIYAAKVVMKTFRHLPMAPSGRWLVVHSDILAGSLCFTGDSTFTIACIYKGSISMVAISEHNNNAHGQLCVLLAPLPDSV